MLLGETDAYRLGMVDINRNGSDKARPDPTGLYCFKVLVMGGCPSSEEFHEKLRINLIGLEGVIQIQDDILVFGSSQQEHNRCLEVLLRHLEE